MTTKAGVFGRKSNWSEEDLQKLRDLWGTMKDVEVARSLGKTVSVVRFKAGILRLREEKGRRAGCRPGRFTYPWSHEEDLVLVKNIGHLNIFELMDLLPRRNRVAIERRCYELGFSPTQGTYTRLKIERDTGYDWRQIRRARDAIGQQWKRYGVRKYMVTFDQVQEIIEWLKNEKRKWSRQYNIDNCVKCGASGTGEREKHSGDGLCKRCWDRRRHNRSWIVNSFKKSRNLALTPEVWLGSICIDDTERAFVQQQLAQQAALETLRETQSVI